MPVYCAISFESSVIHSASTSIEYMTKEYLKCNQVNNQHLSFREDSFSSEKENSRYYNLEMSYTTFEKNIGSLLDISRKFHQFLFLISKRDFDTGFEGKQSLFSKDQKRMISEPIEFAQIIDSIKSKMHIFEFANEKCIEYKLKTG